MLMLKTWFKISGCVWRVLVNHVDMIEEHFDEVMFERNEFDLFDYHLPLSWRRTISYRNQSIALQSKSMDWFLYDNGLRHERVNSNICWLHLRILILKQLPAFTCSKFVRKTNQAVKIVQSQLQNISSGASIVNFEQCSHLFLLFFLLTSNE